MIKQSKIVDLTYYASLNTLEEMIFDPIILSLQILQRAVDVPTDRIRLSKTWDLVYIEFYSKAKEKLILYKHGLYPIEFESTINELKEKDLILERDHQLVLTRSGLKWLSRYVTEISDYPRYSDVISFIDRQLTKNTKELIDESLRKFSNFKLRSKEIGEHKIILVFDWNDFGYGDPEPYLYSLLYSYAKMKGDFYDKLSSNFRDSFKINYADIPEQIDSDKLPLTRPKYKNKIVPLTKIFQKQEPVQLNEDKFEAKNYIHNLWYVVEAINIIHVFENLAPSLTEISKLCLTLIWYAEKKSTFEKSAKKMRDRSIRNEINKLVDWGICKKIIKNGDVRYSITAKSFYDVILERSFQVISPNIITKYYKERIEPFVYKDNLILIQDGACRNPR